MMASVTERVGHTPLPWKYEPGQSCDHSPDGGGGFSLLLRDIDRCGNRNRPRAIDRIDYADGICPGDVEYGEAAANIRFIIRACNAHYDLLEILEDAIPWMERYWRTAPGSFGRIENWLRDARAAIAKAKGGGS